MKSNIKYMLKNWFLWDKESIIYFFIRVPALVLQPIITAYIPKAMIDCIEEGVPVNRLVLVIALLSLLLTFTIWMDPFMQELIRGGARIVRMRYAVMAFQKNLCTDYVNIESLEKREQQKRAEDFYSGRYSGGANFIDRLNQFCVSFVGVITSAALIYKIDVLMIIIILLTCVCEFFILKAINKKQKDTLDSKAKSITKFSYFYLLSKDTKAAKDVKLYSFEDYFIKALAQSLYQIEKISAKFTHQCAAFTATRALLNLIREAVSYAYLVFLVTSGKIGVSDFIFYFGIITGFSNWIMSLVSSHTSIEMNCKDCQAYRDYIENDDEKTSGEHIALSEINKIELKNVSFKYPAADKETLKNIDITFSKGENIAVVGENGAGKTTLIKLICGLYKTTDGKILINGIDADDFSKESYFLPMTIAQNIAVSTNYDKNKLFSAFEQAGILDKINSLPDKENSMMDRNVYKNAVDFSGGEKQRLLLTKAIYKDAPVLILDEPTAALDPIAENELYLKYNELTKGKISFFISHRLSSTRFCDKILFIKDGSIAECGTHEELMAQKGRYYRMYQIQSHYYKEQGVEL